MVTEGGNGDITMIAAVFDARGRKIAEQQVQDTFGGIRLMNMYWTSVYCIIVASNGRVCEMFFRL